MNRIQTLDCSQVVPGAPERVRYFSRQLLTANDMITDQDYYLNKLRRHNLFLHGWGVVCGLEVKAAPDTTKNLPWLVRIEPGYALGPYGDEIDVTAPVFLDLAQCGAGATTNPCDPDMLKMGNPTGTGTTVYVAIKYAECLAQPVRALSAGCACDDLACEFSRIRDSFEIECRTDLPPSHLVPPGPSLCDIVNGKMLPTCPLCPSEPWIVLAKVSLPAVGTTPINDNAINNVILKDNIRRRQVYSTAVLQEQLIACCCKSQTGTADLTIEKSGDWSFTDPNVPEWNADYVITIENKGPSEALNVIVIDQLDDNVLRGQEFFAGQGNWISTSPPEFKAEIGNLMPGQKVILGYTAVTKSFATPKNTAVVSSDTEDPKPENNQANFELGLPPMPDLTITKIGNASGDNIVSYTITVENTSQTMEALGVVVNDRFSKPDVNSMRFEQFSSDPPNKWTDTDEPDFTARLGDLAPGQTVILRYLATFSATVTEAVNTAEVLSRNSIRKEVTSRVAP